MTDHLIAAHFCANPNPSQFPQCAFLHYPGTLAFGDFNAEIECIRLEKLRPEAFSVWPGVPETLGAHQNRGNAATSRL